MFTKSVDFNTEHWAKLNKIASFSGEWKQAVSIANLLLILHISCVKISCQHYTYLFKLASSWSFTFGGLVDVHLLEEDK